MCFPATTIKECYEGRHYVKLPEILRWYPDGRRSIHLRTYTPTVQVIRVDSWHDNVIHIGCETEGLLYTHLHTHPNPSMSQDRDRTNKGASFGARNCVSCYNLMKSL